MKKKRKNAGSTQNHGVMDERTMIREQERLAKEAKRQKTKKIKIAVGVVAAVAVIGGIWYVGWGRNLTFQTVATAVKIEKTVGQTVVYAKITEINGNEITYAVAKEVEEENTGTESDIVPGNEASSEGMGNRGQRGQGGMPSFGNGEMPDMSQMPSGGEGMPSFGDGEMPDMNQMPGGGRGQGGMSFGDGEMPDRSQMGGRGNVAGAVSNIDQFTYDGITYRVGEETATTYIPVGTNVTTKLGTVTTFSRLAANDYVALIMDKDGDEEVIAAVYIVG